MELTTLDVLRMVDIGSGVAEFDESLEKYFVETETFRTLVSGRADIISGDKGTGKTALYRILKDRYTTLPELEAVEVVPAFNITGSPIFQRLVEGDPYSEAQYMTLWKAYFLALAGNWLLALYDESFTDSMFELDALLEKLALAARMTLPPQSSPPSSTSLTSYASEGGGDGDHNFATGPSSGYPEAGIRRSREGGRFRPDGSP